MTTFKLDEDRLLFGFDVVIPHTIPNRVSPRQFVTLLTDVAREKERILCSQFPYLVDIDFGWYDNDSYRISLDVEVKLEAIGNPKTIADIESQIQQITDDLTQYILKLWGDVHTIVATSQLMNQHLR